MIAPTSFFADYGCHVRILEESRILRRLGHRVVIATYYNGRNVDGLDIRRTLPIPWRRRYEVGSSRHKLAFDVLLAGAALATAIRVRPHVIHGHLHEGALIGAVVGRLLGVPTVFDLQGSLTSEMVDHGFLDPEGRWFGLMRRIEAAIDRLPSAIVTSTARAAVDLVHQFDVAPYAIYPMPDGVSLDTFRPGLLPEPERTAFKTALGIPADRKVVVYLGLLAAYQGTDHLLDAARIVVETRPDTHFLVMGFPGTDVYHAKADALGLGDHVTFTGRVDYAQAPFHLALGDVAVAPKLSATESSGKILNYMAMGLPVVAFSAAASQEFLRGLGRYAAPGDSTGFARRIIELLDDPVGAAALGQKLRSRAAESYSWEAAGQKLIAVYDAVDPVLAEAGG
jgi:glycosyltransferase involved in cell wall biosynthesis